MLESGEKERLKELLRERLIECGWRDEMKALCRLPTLILIQLSVFLFTWINIYLLFFMLFRFLV